MFIILYKNHPKKSMDKEYFALGLTCCYPGAYGTNSDCPTCPIDKPAYSSCNCLNTLISDCKQCTICEKLVNGECAPKCDGAYRSCSIIKTNKGNRDTGIC